MLRPGRFAYEGVGGSGLTEGKRLQFPFWVGNERGGSVTHGPGTDHNIKLEIVNYNERVFNYWKDTERGWMRTWQLLTGAFVSFSYR